MANNKAAGHGQSAPMPLELTAPANPATSAGSGSWPQIGFADYDLAGGGGLQRYLHALRRRWLMALIIALPISAIAAYAVWSLQPRVFTATAVLRLGATEKALIFETADNHSTANSFEIYKRTQRQLLRSQFVVMHALRDEALAGLPVLQEEADPAEWLEMNLNVTFPDESEVMHVSLSGGKSDGLHQVVNAVVKAYFDEVVFAEKKIKQKRRDDLQDALAKAESELRSKKNELKSLNEKAGTNDSPALNVVQQQLLQQYTTKNQDYSRIVAERRKALEELKQHEEVVKAEDDDEVISEPELLLAMRTDRVCQENDADRQKVLDLMETTRGRLKKDVPEGPKLQEYVQRLKIIDDKLSSRKKEMQKELGANKRQTAAVKIETLKKDIARLTAEEEQLHPELQKLEADAIKQIGKSSIDVEMLRGEIKVVQENYDHIGAELGRTNVELQADLKEALARVTKLSDALPARTADAKSRMTKTIGAGVVWLALPILFFVWLDVRKDRVNSGAEVVQGLGLNVIGAVPLVPHRVMRQLNGSSARQQYWRTLLSESVDSIAAVLLRGSKSGGLRVVMVSSATAGEGKTTLAANLATSLAGAGCRTILVDFDLRRPALHRLFDLSMQPGINDVLRDPASIDSVVQLTHIPNLAFLAAGRWNAMGLAGLASADLKGLFDHLQAGFDFVVVDGSPVLPVVDTRLIAQHVDTVVLSVLRDVSRIPQVRAAGQLLETFAVPILGVVLTGSRGDAYPHSHYEPYLDAKAV